MPYALDTYLDAFKIPPLLNSLYIENLSNIAGLRRNRPYYTASNYSNLFLYSIENLDRFDYIYPTNIFSSQLFELLNELLTKLYTIPSFFSSVISSHLRDQAGRYYLLFKFKRDFSFYSFKNNNPNIPRVFLEDMIHCLDETLNDNICTHDFPEQLVSYLTKYINESNIRPASKSDLINALNSRPTTVVNEPFNPCQQEAYVLYINGFKDIVAQADTYRNNFALALGGDVVKDLINYVNQHPDVRRLQVDAQQLVENFLNNNISPEYFVEKFNEIKTARLKYPLNLDESPDVRLMEHFDKQFELYYDELITDHVNRFDELNVFSSRLDLQDPLDLIEQIKSTDYLPIRIPVIQ